MGPGWSSDGAEVLMKWSSDGAEVLMKAVGAITVMVRRDWMTYRNRRQGNDAPGLRGWCQQATQQ
jgi:hypothetical protein